MQTQQNEKNLHNWFEMKFKFKLCVESQFTSISNLNMCCVKMIESHPRFYI